MSSTKTLTDVSLEVLKKRLKTQDPNAKFNFVYFGDSWFDWGDANRKGQQTEAAKIQAAKKDAIRRYQIFRSCLAAASKIKPKPLVILYGGDGPFSGSREQLTYFRDTVETFVKKHNIPFFMVPGNHERDGLHGTMKNFQDIIGPRKGTLQENALNYILNTPKLRMVMLNDIGPVTKTPQNVKPEFFYGISPNALATFNKGVNTKKTVLVVMHVPPKDGVPFAGFSIGDVFPISPNANNAFKKTNPKFIANLRKAGNVKLVLVSHIHDKVIKGQIAGKVAVLNGNGGAGENTKPTPNPIISSFTFHPKTNHITVNKPIHVKVNTTLRPNKVFILIGSTFVTIPITSFDPKRRRLMSSKRPRRFLYRYGA